LHNDNTPGAWDCKQTKHNHTRQYKSYYNHYNNYFYSYNQNQMNTPRQTIENQILTLADTRTADRLISTFNQTDIKELGAEDLALIIEYSRDDKLVQECQRLLRNTDWNAKVEYNNYNGNNMALLSEDLQDDSIGAGWESLKELTDKIREETEKFYMDIQALKATKERQGSMGNLKNNMYHQKLVQYRKEFLKAIKKKRNDLYFQIEMGLV